MTSPVPAMAGKPAARGVMVVLLIRLAAVHVVSIYACVFTVIHWLRDVPIHDSWTIGVIGFVLLFLAFGVMVTGRSLGFFSTPQHQFSVDWLPLLLVWPLGLSIWACFALGLTSVQAKQQMTNGIALPLMVLAATVPPLLLGRIPSWPEPRKGWHKLLDGHYAIATIAAAVTLFLAMQSALEQDPPVGNPPSQTAAVAPAAGPVSGTAQQPGFVCDRTKAAQADPEDEEGANQCPPPRAASPPPATAASPTANSSPVAAAASVKPIDQYVSSWGGIWMLISGVLLGAARFMAAKRGGAAMAGAIPGLAPLHLPEQGKELAGQLISAAQTQVAAQAGSWLRNSGLPNADMLATVMGKILGPGSSAQPAVSAPLVGLPETSAAATSPPPTLAASPLPPVQAVPPPPAPVPVSVPEPPPPPPLPQKPPAVTASPSPASPSAPAPAPDNAEAAALRERVKDMDSALTKQQDTATQLQSTMGAMQDKLEKQSQAMAQVMAESQRAAEESRRTIDSLTRLMQGMKADLDRLSRNQAEGS